MADSSVPAQAIRVSGTIRTPVLRSVPGEVPVAFVYNGSTYAVMMASPSDLDDFARGFTLTEGVIAEAGEIESLDIIEQEAGIELRMWLAARSGRSLEQRRRRLAGPVGCGLCGIESLEAAVRKPPQVTGLQQYSPAHITAALAALAPAQQLNQVTRAVHAAAFWTPSRGLVAVTEDVGRHNALDKLAGRLLRLGVAPADGMVLLTSRVSVEMVQKAAMIGALLIVAISAPTALAIDVAEEAGLTLVAVARPDSFEIFTHPDRIAHERTGTGDNKVTVDAA